MTHYHVYTNEKVEFRTDMKYIKKEKKKLLTYRALSGYIECGSGIINVSVITTVPWVVYKSR
jgi:hypothetical protein